MKERDGWLESYQWPPSDVADSVTGKRVVKDRFNISVMFALERLLALSEADFTFQVELFVFVSWEDPRIFYRCEGASIGGFDPSDPCGLFWQPTFSWPNLVPEAGEEELVPSLIEDMGFRRRSAASSGTE